MNANKIFHIERNEMRHKKLTVWTQIGWTKFKILLLVRILNVKPRKITSDCCYLNKNKWNNFFKMSWKFWKTRCVLKELSLSSSRAKTCVSTLRARETNRSKLKTVKKLTIIWISKWTFHRTHRSLCKIQWCYNYSVSSIGLITQHTAMYLTL